MDYWASVMLSFQDCYAPCALDMITFKPLREERSKLSRTVCEKMTWKRCKSTSRKRCRLITSDRVYLLTSWELLQPIWPLVYSGYHSQHSYIFFHCNWLHTLYRATWDMTSWKCWTMTRTVSWHYKHQVKMQKQINKNLFNSLKTHHLVRKDKRITKEQKSE